MFLPLLLLVFGGVFGSDHCPEKLPIVLKDQTGFKYEGNPAAGNKFLLTFYENHPSFDPLYHHTIFATTEEREVVSFTVEAPGIGFKSVAMATSGKVVSVQVPTFITNSSATHVSNRTVIVEAEKGKTIIVYGINEKFKSVDAFLILPMMPTDGFNMSYKYIAATYTTDFPGFLAIIPQFSEGNTEVNVYFHLSGISRVPYFHNVANNTFHYNNDILHLTLNASESIYLIGQGDATGTVIVTDRPISVFSGLQCTYVPTSILACDHLVEQFPPVSTWGTRFVTVPLKYRTAFDVFRFIAAYNCTNVSISCVSSVGLPASSWTFTLDEAQYRETNITSDEYCIVKSTNRLLVLQYSVGDNADVTHMGDPFMAVLPPADRFSNNLTFANYEGSVQTYKHVVNIVIPAAFFQPDCIYLSNSRLSDLTFDVVAIPDGYKIAYYGVRVDIEVGSHTLYHTNQHAGFGILVYGLTSGASYGYPGAYPVKGFDIDLYNLNVVNTSDKCITVMWDHPPDVTPRTLTYNMVLRDEKDFEYEWSTLDTQGTVCNLNPGMLYTFWLTSKGADSKIHTSQARNTMLRVKTIDVPRPVSTSNLATTAAPVTTSDAATAVYVVVPISILLLVNIISGVVIFLLTRHCYRKRRELENAIKFNPNTDCIYENIHSKMYTENTAAGNTPDGLYAEIQTNANPSYCPVEKMVDTLY